MTDLEKYKYRIAVTGGAGFIGSNLLHYMVAKYNDYFFINIDCLTYAGNLSNLQGIEKRVNYVFEKININDFDRLQKCFDKHDINAIIHLAAESHVDRSIIGPADFINSNIIGTFNLLELARQRKENFRFHHVSTDEVFGSIDGEGRFTEMSRYNPSSPYAAAKAASDHLVRAYHKTYNLNTVITNSSNNFGPYQFPEKLIPLTIRNAVEGLSIPVYGDGKNIRDWLYVEDHCRAIDLVFHKGKTGETYNIGGNNEYTNIDLVTKVCRIIDEIKGGDPRDKLIKFVEDRPGHDYRYAIDTSKIMSNLRWKPAYDFNTALRNTVKWYLENKKWVSYCVSGEYKDYYNKIYG